MRRGRRCSRGTRVACSRESPRGSTLLVRRVRLPDPRSLGEGGQPDHSQGPGAIVKPTIVRKIPRADAHVIETLGELGVATVHEAQGRTGLMRPYMRPVYPKAHAA